MSLAKKEVEVDWDYVCNYPENTEMFLKRDVRKAVQRVLKKIRELPNRDDTIMFKNTRVCVLDGGGVGKFEVINLIEKMFGVEWEIIING